MGIDKDSSPQFMRLMDEKAYLDELDHRLSMFCNARDRTRFSDRIMGLRADYRYARKQAYTPELQLEFFPEFERQLEVLLERLIDAVESMRDREKREWGKESLPHVERYVRSFLLLAKSSSTLRSVLEPSWVKLANSALYWWGGSYASEKLWQLRQQAQGFLFEEPSFEEFVAFLEELRRVTTEIEPFVARSPERWDSPREVLLFLESYAYLELNSKAEKS